METVGLDIGTSSISAVVLDVEQKTVLESRTVPNDSFLRTGREEEKLQDVSVIFRTAKTVLDELLDLFPEAVSIGLTGQMHGILYLDEKGCALSPLYTWQDLRAEKQQYDGRSAVQFIRENCGREIYAGYGLATHIFLQRQNELPENAAALCTAADYLGCRLTGRVRPLMHSSMAASLGLFDIAGGDFRKEDLRLLGADPGLLPSVTEDFCPLGTYRGRPVALAVGDNQAAFLGSLEPENGAILLNIGTGAQISVFSDRFYEIEGIETRPLTRGTYLLAGSALCGGRAYAILEQFFRSYLASAGFDAGLQYDVMQTLAEKSLGADQMKVVTTFLGTRKDPTLRGLITNLSEENFTPEGLVQGVLAGMAEELWEMYLLIRDATGLEARWLTVSGNGARKNRALRQILEKRFALPLQLSKTEEEAACGAALVGASIL